MRDNLSSIPSTGVKYAWLMGEVRGGEVYPMSFAARIRGAMARKTWAQEPMTLMEKWAEKYGDKRTPSRQTFYAWFKAVPPKIEPEKLFDLGELLDVNPAWLALKSDDMSRPFTPGIELAEFLDAYRNLGPKGRDALVNEATKEARKLLDVQGEASIARPYKKTPAR